MERRGKTCLWGRMERSGKTLSRPLAATDNVLDSNTKGEELSRPLPQELVERILAMVPFPQIFKARALSKSWHARLSSISSQDDEGKKLLAASFQKLVCEWSNKWMTSRPVFLFEEFLIAYDRAAQHWRQIPTLSVLPDEAGMKLKWLMLRNGHYPPSVVGALLFITTFLPAEKIFVINIFTGSWKELPALPCIHRPSRTRKRLVSSKEMYKVIMLWTDAGCACAWIYDSKLGSWRSKTLEVLKVGWYDFKVGWYDVYLNGVLYVVVHVQHMLWGFLAFDVENETFNLLQMPPTDIIYDDVQFLQLEACNGTVYVVVPKNRILLEADLVSRKWSKVIHGPPAALKFDFFWRNVSRDGDCLFFYEEGTCAKILAYNVRKEEWSRLPTNWNLNQCSRLFNPVGISTSFQPGMNPFLEV